MAKFEDLVDRVDRLVLRHHELKRTHQLLQQQLAAVAAERDGLRQRLTTARARIDGLLVRLPPDVADEGDMVRHANPAKPAPEIDGDSTHHSSSGRVT